MKGILYQRYQEDFEQKLYFQTLTTVWCYGIYSRRFITWMFINK